MMNILFYFSPFLFLRMGAQIIFAIGKKNLFPSNHSLLGMGGQLILLIIFSLTLSDALPIPCKTQKSIQVQNSGRGGVGACSLTHNTLRGRGACWSSKM